MKYRVEQEGDFSKHILWLHRGIGGKAEDINEIVTKVYAERKS